VAALAQNGTCFTAVPDRTAAMSQTAYPLRAVEVHHLTTHEGPPFRVSLLDAHECVPRGRLLSGDRWHLNGHHGRPFSSLGDGTRLS
jgi:hypothetical protein